MTMNLDIGPQAILAYRRLAYTAWHALAEFVDNSTQSYANHAPELNRAYKRESKAENPAHLCVTILYDAKNGIMTIEDNAMGMNETELGYALKIAHPPTNRSGRSEYGLGLKTAACWLGDLWTITTRRLGDPFEHEVTIDVKEVSRGTAKKPKALPYRKRENKDNNTQHYTRIEIRRLHQRFAGRTLGKIKDYLASMYRYDISQGKLKLVWQGEELSFNALTDFAPISKKPGEVYREEFDFKFEMEDQTFKRVWGWYGILGDKRRGRGNAGFVVLRRGRALRAHPDQWRPEIVFGDERNDLINQRITGEINLDDFQVSHTKDWIQWQGDEEDRLEVRLKEEMQDYLDVARGMRVTKGRARRGPNDLNVQKAVDVLKREVDSEEFRDHVRVDDLPSAEVIALNLKPLLMASRGATPRLIQTIGKAKFSLFVAFDASPNDPYCAHEVDGNSVRIVVNANHPHWAQIAGDSGVLNYLRHCTYDAVAEYKCTLKRAELRPATVKYIKDALLRLPSEIAVGERDDEAEDEDEVDEDEE